MDLTKVELVIHPVRLRILQTLLSETLTTQEIAERLPDVPTSSIYRHLKLLLESEMVIVAEERLVNGIRERVYGLSELPHIGREEMATLSVDEHFRYFTIYVLTLLRGFAAYLSSTVTADGTVDLAADHAGYTEITFFADEEELVQFERRLAEAVQSLLTNGATAGRRKYKLATVAHPIRITPRGGNSGDTDDG